MAFTPSFRIRGIPVQVDPTFVLIALLFGWTIHQDALIVVWVVLVFVSVLAHELGHAVAFRHYGRQPEIVLQGMGGYTTGGNERLSPGRDLIVSLAGPLTGLALLGIPAMFLAAGNGPSDTWDKILSDAVFVNVAWSVLNLLPVLPLDGGRVSSAVLTLASGPRQGERVAHIVSMVVAAAGGLYALYAGLVFGALFAGFFFFYNLNQLRQIDGRTGAGPGGDPQDPYSLRHGWRSLDTGDIPGAQAAAGHCLSQRPAPPGPVRAEATELLAWARFCQGGAADARKALAELPKAVLPSRSLRAALALDAGDRATAVDLMVDAYRDHEFGAYSRTMAEALARTGLVDELVDRLVAPGGPGPQSVAALAVHLHGARQYGDATRAGERAFMAGGAQAGRVAYNLACSHAGAGQVDAALSWLGRAVDAGFADLTLLDQDPDLDTLRPDRRFLAIRARVAGRPEL